VWLSHAPSRPKARRSIVSARNAERGEPVVQSILDTGGEARFAAADPSTGDGVRARAAAGPVDILVNKAAMLVAPQPAADISEDVIDRALAAHLRV
jgi:NAD(P)-dependent dehydrogenase (short-subunit alcohol dehydrogenase family)